MIKTISMFIHGRKGFTLLEIMIALAIVGSVVVVSLYTINYHTDVAFEQNIATNMLLKAKEKITEMKINPKNTKGVIQGTDFTYENVMNKTDDEEIVELKTIIEGDGKKVVLSELVSKQVIQKLQ